MRPTQFWVLVVLSAVVSLCMVKEISLSRAIIHQSYLVVDQHERSSTDAYYKDEWEKLALSAYRAGRQDPAMMELLKEEGVTVHQGPPPGPALPSPANNGPASPPLSAPQPSQQPAPQPGTP